MLIYEWLKDGGASSTKRASVVFTEEPKGSSRGSNSLILAQGYIFFILNPPSTPLGRGSMVKGNIKKKRWIKRGKAKNRSVKVRKEGKNEKNNGKIRGGGDGKRRRG